MLCAALLAGACSGDSGGPAASDPPVRIGASGFASSPSPKLTDGPACATAQARTKPVPAEAQALLRTFVAAVDRGDASAARRALDPAFADQVLAGLASTRRLTLLSVSDGY